MLPTLHTARACVCPSTEGSMNRIDFSLFSRSCNAIRPTVQYGDLIWQPDGPLARARKPSMIAALENGASLRALPRKSSVSDSGCHPHPRLGQTCVYRSLHGGLIHDFVLLLFVVGRKVHFSEHQAWTTLERVASF